MTASVFNVLQGLSSSCPLEQGDASLVSIGEEYVLRLSDDESLDAKREKTLAPDDEDEDEEEFDRERFPMFVTGADR